MFGGFRTSEKDSFPRTNFAKGSTGLTMLNAFEWPGLLLVHLVILQTVEGRKILASQFNDKLSSHLKRVASKRKKDKKQAAKVKLLQKHHF